jgi:hypothetical protein
MLQSARASPSVAFKESKCKDVSFTRASRSYLTCQNEFRDTFPDSPVPKKSTITRLVNRFRDTETLHPVVSNTRKIVNPSLNAVDISNT